MRIVVTLISIFDTPLQGNAMIYQGAKDKNAFYLTGLA